MRISLKPILTRAVFKNIDVVPLFSIYIYKFLLLLNCNAMWFCKYLPLEASLKAGWFVSVS